MTTALAGNLASHLHRRPGLGKCVIASILPSPTISFPAASPYDGRLPTLSQAKRGSSKSLPPESLSNQISTEQVVHFEEEQFFDNIITDDEFLDEDDFDDYDFEDDDDLKLADYVSNYTLATTILVRLEMEGKVVEWCLRGPGRTKRIHPWQRRSPIRSTETYKYIENIQVRIENLSNKTLLDEAEQMGKVPDNISLEVSSLGIERVVRVDLERFKELPLYVKYVAQVGSEKERDGIFQLVSYDLEAECCTWALADVRINREQTGQGRTLSKKQREWKLQTPFDCVHIVRRYPEF